MIKFPFWSQKYRRAPPKKFCKYNRSKRLPQKNAPSFPHNWPIFGRKFEKNRVFGDLAATLLPKFSAISAEKTTFVEKKIVQFLCTKLCTHPENLSLVAPKAAELPQCPVFGERIVTAWVLALHAISAGRYQS